MNKENKEMDRRQLETIDNKKGHSSSEDYPQDWSSPSNMIEDGSFYEEAIKLSEASSAGGRRELRDKTKKFTEETEGRHLKKKKTKQHKEALIAGGMGRTGHRIAPIP